MKTRRIRNTRAGFTLIELIGVMAIIAILATIAVPATLRTVDRAAMRAEQTIVNRIAEHARLNVLRTGKLPTTASWKTDLKDYSEQTANGFEYNARHMARVLLVDPAAPNARVLVLSSMRTGLTLPTTVNATSFQEIWNTPDGQRPGSWTSWPAEYGEFLVIGRANVSMEMHTYDLLLRNNTSTNSSYEIVGLGATAGKQTAGPGNTTVRLRSGWRLDLYRTAADTQPSYSYLVANYGRTFVFDGTNWTAP